MKKSLTLAMLVLSIYTQAQVKIGNNPATINANSLLELESTNKGFLPPRVALNSISTVSPLTGTVPAGMLVYSTGGTLTDGYYYWDGAKWKMVGTSKQNMVTKTANATLLQTEGFVLASNDITLTLPVVTSADDGLQFTVKNLGSHTDLITIAGNSGATVDGMAQSYLTRYMGQTFVATGGNWIIKEARKFTDNILDVDDNCSWTTIQEAIDFLNLHMFGSTVIRVANETNNVASTIIINLPYPVTIEGTSFGNSTIAAASGLAGKPMFRCLTECYFKMLVFDATTLINYGTLAGEDAIRLVGIGTYHEIKDCTFDRFYNAILDSSNAQLWLFECDINDAQANGLLVYSAMDSVIIKVAETDFTNCKVGIDLEKGNKATIQLSSGEYYNASSTDTAIVYTPATFTSFVDIHITGNLWNNIGRYIDGFDFTRADGRDANAYIQSNAGMGDKNPTCKINVINNATVTNTTAIATWYKVNWTNTSSLTTKWTISDNKITYQSANRRDAYIIISGDLASSSSASTVNIGIVKNGISGTRYAETTLKTTSANIPFQFSMVVFLSDLGPGDYLELWVNANQASSTVTVEDIQWFVNTQ